MGMPLIRLRNPYIPLPTSVQNTSYGQFANSWCTCGQIKTLSSTSLKRRREVGGFSIFFSDFLVIFGYSLVLNV